MTLRLHPHPPTATNGSAVERTTPSGRIRGAARRRRRIERPEWPRLRLTWGGASHDAQARSFSRRSLACTLVVLVLAVAGGCSSDDGAPERAGGGDGAASASTAPGGFAFAVTTAAVEPMATKAPDFPTDVTAAVSTSLDAWLADAIVAPLRTGKPASGLDAVFTEPALAKVATPGTERAALVEEGTPLSGDVHQERANARLTALTAPGGEVVLVTAQIDMVHTVSSGDGAVDVVRAGEVVLVPDRGSWRIDGFDIVTKHDTRAK